LTSFYQENKHWLSFNNENNKIIGFPSIMEATNIGFFYQENNTHWLSFSNENNKIIGFPSIMDATNIGFLLPRKKHTLTFIQ
jgi:hypothetical protein